MLEGKNISFVRENTPLFTGLSFHLKQGKKLTVKGTNGSGKSTLLRLLAGLLPLNTNQLIWEGQRLSKRNLSTYQQYLLYIGHKHCLHPEILVQDQLYLWHILYKIPKHILEQSLEQWGLGHCQQKKTSHLSQGQQKRLALTRCFWLKRPLWIMDEPESALDQEGQDYLDNMLTTHLEKGGMVIHATHQKGTPEELIVNLNG